MRGSLIAILLSFLAAGVFARTPQQDEKDYGQTLNNVDLQSYTLYVQKKTKKRFLWTEELGLKNKRVNFRSDKPIDNSDELFKIYENILQISGLILVAIPGDTADEVLYKIKAAATGQKEYLPPIDEKVKPEDRYITRVFHLQHVPAREVHAALINMVSFPQAILAIDSAGLLLITDYDWNIKRLDVIVKEMDLPKPDIIMRRIELRHALASDVETMMNTLVQTIIARQTPQRIPVQPGLPGAQEPVKVVADKRTNAVLILAEPARIEQIEKIIRELDSETGFETSGIYITHLKHVSAVDMVKTLNAMYRISTDDKGVPSGGSGTRPGQAIGPTSTTGTTPPGTGSPSAGGGALTGNEPTIVADIRSNSILIITDRNTYKRIEETIRKLDQRRPQVLIKASVVEVKATDNFDLGVELARIVDPTGHTPLVGRTQFGNSVLTPDPTNNTFTITPINTAGITLALLNDKIGNIAFLMRALKEKAKVSITDEPEVATIDNGTAKMTVKDQVPVSQIVTNAAGTQQTAFLKYEEAETTLSISPHIGDIGYLRLDTTIKIEKFTTASTDPTRPPPKSSRQLDTTSILVPNGRTIVIGGIVTEDLSDSVSGVPLLMDVPILGFLFRRTIKTVEKKTLYIFITPYILYDESFGDLKDLTAERKEEIEKLRGVVLRKFQVEPLPDPTPASTFRFSAPEDAVREERRR